MSVWKRIFWAVASFFGFFPLEGKREYGQFPFRFRALPLNWLISVYGLIVVFSIFYTVGKEENATIRVLGAYTETTGPGLHVKLPWPISKVRITQVTPLHRMEIGYKTLVPGTTPPKYQSNPAESIMLTGDENIADLSWAVQYRTADAYKWQFVVQDPKKLLRLLAQASMRLVIGKTDFDAAATTGKSEVQLAATSLLQELCDEIDFGVKISLTNLGDVYPPSEQVKADFKDVVNALEDKQKKIHQAEEYRNEIIPNAKGQAQQMINESKGYASRQVSEARGKANRWLSVWNEYKQNKDITKARLRLEAMQEVLPHQDMLVDMTAEKSSLGILKHLDINPKTAKEAK